MDTNEARHSTAHYFLEGLNEIGFDYLFCNFGTDHAPLIEAMAQFRRDGRLYRHTQRQILIIIQILKCHEAKMDG